MAAYFIKNGGNDANTGLSDAQAWATETQVETEWQAGTFVAGDTISFKRGDAWTFTGRIFLTNASNGAIGNHIIIGAYDTGADPAWDTGFAVRFGFLSIQADYVTVQDLELMDYHDSHGIRIDGGEHIILQRLYIHDMTSVTLGNAVRTMNDARHVWILDCIIEDIASEGLYFGTGDDVDLTRQCWVNNCQITNCTYEGVEIKDRTTEIYVTNCTLIGNGKSGGPGGDSLQISLGGRFNVIYNCRFEGVDGNHAAIYAGRYQGGTETNSGKYNTIERCLFLNCTGFYGGIRAGGIVTGEGNRITNCTFVNCSNGIYCTAGAAGYVIRNCIFSGITSYPINMQVAQTRYDVDYNDYGDGDANAWYESGAARALAAYVQGVLGQELNGISTAPSFAEAGMYTLQVGSGAVDTGDSTATAYDWNDEYVALGGAVDMGWREYDYASVNERLGGLPHRIFRSIHDESAVFGRYTGTVGTGLSVAGNVPTPIQGKRSINVDILDITDRYAYRTGLGDLDHFYVSLQINTDDLSMTNGDEFDIFHGLNGVTVLMRIHINYDGANFRVRASARLDSIAWDYTSYFDLSAGWNHIEALWSRAPDTSVNDGQLALWVNDVEEEHIDDMNNHDNTIDNFRVGAPDALDVGTSGTLYIDVVRLDWLRYMGDPISTTTYLYTTAVVVVLI